MLPRIIGVLVAATIDYYTYRLSKKLIGNGGGAAAVSDLSDSTEVVAFPLPYFALQRPSPSQIAFHLSGDYASRHGSGILPATPVGASRRANQPIL